MFHPRRRGIVPIATADISVMSDNDKTGEWAMASQFFIEAGKDRP